MSARAGIVVTGTEVLTGRVSDRNGPWLSERLAEIGIDTAHITVVGDRPQDMLAALRFMEQEGMDVVVTSGGLGPTADDLTIEIVGRFAGRELVLDEPLMARIAEILKPLLKRWPDLDPDAVLASNRKQAMIPEGSTIIYPVGTAPGLVVPPVNGSGPTVVVLPGPPRELQPMWETAVGTDAFKTAAAGAGDFQQGMLRLFGIPESEIAETLRAAEREGIAIEDLEITTCLRRAEVEVVTRYEPETEAIYEALVEFVRQRLPEALFSEDGSTVDDQVIELLKGPPQMTIAVAESCTGGLMAARLTERPGSSVYALGGVVAYSNDAKIAFADVDAALIEEFGAVSVEVAAALARGAAARFGANVGIGITGIAGPDGGTEEKPVGTVCFSAFESGGRSLTRQLSLPGDRATIRDRSTTVAMHLVRRLLHGEGDPAP